RVERKLVLGQRFAVPLEPVRGFLVGFRAPDERDTASPVDADEVGDRLADARPVVDADAGHAGQLAGNRAHWNPAEALAELRQAIRAALVADGTGDDENCVDVVSPYEREDMVA